MSPLPWLLLMWRVRSARVGRGDGIWLWLACNVVTCIGVRGHVVLRCAVVEMRLAVRTRGGGIQMGGCDGIDSSPLAAGAVVVVRLVAGHGIGLQRC